MNPSRGVDRVDAACRAGIIASRKGSANAVPAPQRNVRRSSAFLRMIIFVPFSPGLFTFVSSGTAHSLRLPPRAIRTCNCFPPNFEQSSAPPGRRRTERFARSHTSTVSQPRFRQIHPDAAAELSLIRQLHRIFIRNSGIAFTPLSNGIKIFHRKPDGIHTGMAA